MPCALTGPAGLADGIQRVPLELALAVEAVQAGRALPALPGGQSGWVCPLCRVEDGESVVERDDVCRQRLWAA